MFDAWMAGSVQLRPDQRPGVGAIGTAFGGNKLPFLAAQMAKGDTIVTSDYGVIVPVTIDIIALADKAPLEKLSNGVSTGFTKPVANAACPGDIRDNHLYESVGYNGITIAATNAYDNYGAITMPATHEIVYSEKAFDLAQFVETHAKYTHYAKLSACTMSSTSLTTPRLMRRPVRASTSSGLTLMVHLLTTRRLVTSLYVQLTRTVTLWLMQPLLRRL